MSRREPIGVERLREALASLEPQSNTGPPADPARIFDAVHGELGTDERAAIVDASVDDADMAEAWRLAVDLGQPAAARPSRGVPWTWLGIAAVLALGVGVGWQQFGQRRGEEAPVYRSVEDRQIGSMLPADAVLPRQAPVLRWTPIAGARYQVKVFTADLEPLADVTGLASAEYTLPPDVLSRVPAGAVILWQVQADMAGDAVVSPTFSARLE